MILINTAVIAAGRVSFCLRKAHGAKGHSLMRAKKGKVMQLSEKPWCPMQISATRMFNG